MSRRDASPVLDDGFTQTATSRFTRKVAKPFNPEKIKLPRRRGRAGVLVFEHEERLAALIRKRLTVAPKRRERLEHDITIKREFIARLRAEMQKDLRS